jgi:proteasome accessory factor C
MSSAGEQLARLLALVPWLRAHPGVSPQEVADEFGISTEQLEADLNLLIVCGMPGGQHGDLFDIEFWAGEANDTEDSDQDDDGPVRLGTSITVHDAQNLDRPMRLRPDEAVSLLLGLNLLKALPGRFDRDRLEALSARLEAVAGDALAAVDGAVTVAPLSQPDPELQATLEGALSRGHRLDLDYLVPSRDEVTTRQVDPVRLALVDGRQYLIAWCRSAQDWRHFRVDRIVRATETEAPTEPHEHDVTTPPARVSYTPDADAHRVVLDLTPAGRWIAEYAVVDHVTEPSTPGVTRVELSTASLPWVAQLVLRSGGGARVVEPVELADLVVARANAALTAQQAGEPSLR